LLSRLLLLLLAVACAAPAFAADEGAGRAYVMKGALAGGPDPFDDIVTTMAFGRKLGEHWYVDFLYKNEGHADEGHRDGFGLQLFYQRNVAGRLSAEVGGGVLWTFNTRRVAGIEVNDKQHAWIVSAALLYRLQNSYYLRAQYDNVQAEGSFRSHTVLLGLQADFGQRTPRDADAAREVTLLAGFSMMNTSEARASAAVQLESRRYLGSDFACSISLLAEAHNRISSRQSLAGQCWYVKQISPTWRMSAGLGPIITHAAYIEDDTRIGALISLEASKRINEAWEAGARFSRLAVPTVVARDADLLMLFGRVLF
jgi:hypothetical protein